MGDGIHISGLSGIPVLTIIGVDNKRDRDTVAKIGRPVVFLRKYDLDQQYFLARFPYWEQVSKGFT